MAISRDDKDWTWVLQRSCAWCGYDASALERRVLADAVSAKARRMSGFLASHPHPATRPSEDVWSPLEYCCHVRDLQRVFAQRIESMLSAASAPTLPNWDQDQAAIDDRYETQTPAVVALLVAESGAALSAVLQRVRGQDWQRRALRSNGSSFTVETLARYGLHDVEHHWFDVTGRRADRAIMSP